MHPEFLRPDERIRRSLPGSLFAICGGAEPQAVQDSRSGSCSLDMGMLTWLPVHGSKMVRGMGPAVLQDRQNLP